MGAQSAVRVGLEVMRWGMTFTLARSAITGKKHAQFMKTARLIHAKVISVIG